MEENRVYKVYPSNLDIFRTIKEFDEYLSKSGYKPNKKSEGCRLSLQIDPHRWLNADSWPEFLDLLERYPLALPSFNFGWTKKGNIAIALAVTVSKSGLVISANSDDHDRVAGLHEALKTVFKASNPVSYNPISRYNLKKSIFVAHRFDDRGNEVARIISKYCSLLGFEVKDGLGYESRVIPDKVSERIQSQDIFIVIFTEGKHDWLISEMAYAKGLDKYLIVLADGSLEIAKGIVGGDFEHVSFPPDNPYRCLMDLLYVLPH